MADLLPRMRAKHDQQLARACAEVFTCPPEFAVLLSKTDTEAMEYVQATPKDLWNWLLRYARLGHSATCLAVIDRIDLEQGEVTNG